MTPLAPMALVAVVLAAASAASLLPSTSGPRRRASRLAGVSGHAVPTRVRTPRYLSRLALVGLGIPALALPALLHPGTLAPVAVATVALAAAARRRAALHAAREAEARREAVVELCLALAAELRAGRPPQAALPLAVAATAPLRPLLTPALAALRSGGDVAAALQAAAPRPRQPRTGTRGAEGLRQVAACWRVAASSGAGLAAALDRVAEGLRSEQAVRREVLAQLAAPRATARLLAALPIFALLLGSGIGARPLEVLLHTPLGLACLTVGLLLSGAGVAWTDRMARAAEEQV